MFLKDQVVSLLASFDLRIETLATHIKTHKSKVCQELAICKTEIFSQVMTTYKALRMEVLKPCLNL